MFRATMCTLSGETIVFMTHLLLVILYDDCLVCRVEFALHTRQSFTQNNKYQVSHKYRSFFWWWGYTCPKRVDKLNKYTKNNCERSWFYLQDCTGMQVNET